MIHRVGKNQQAALRALLQAGGRSFINLRQQILISGLLNFAEILQLQIECAVSDDVQSEEESRGFFHGLIGTVVPWRLLTEMKPIFFVE